MINRQVPSAFKQKKGLRTRHRPRRFDASSRCSLSQQSVTTKSGLTFPAPVAHVLSHAHSNMFANVFCVLVPRSPSGRVT